MIKADTQRQNLAYQYNSHKYLQMYEKRARLVERRGIKSKDILPIRCWEESPKLKIESKKRKIRKQKELTENDETTLKQERGKKYREESEKRTEFLKAQKELEQIGKRVKKLKAKKQKEGRELSLYKFWDRKYTDLKDIKTEEKRTNTMLKSLKISELKDRIEREEDKAMKELREQISWKWHITSQMMTIFKQ